MNRVPPGLGRAQGSARYAQGSKNRVVETEGGSGPSVLLEHEGPEQGAGRFGASVGEDGSAIARASAPVVGSGDPIASPSDARWIT